MRLKEMDEIIKSLDNPKIKLIKSLQKRKYRDRLGLYFIEGTKMVNEAIAWGHPFHTLILSENYDSNELVSCGSKVDFSTMRVDTRVFKDISDVKTPQGVIGVLKKKEYDIDLIFKKGNMLWIALDRIQDPGNMGTIIRTVDAAGVGGIIILKGSVDPYNLKCIRSTMGSILRVPIIEVSHRDYFFESLIKKGAKILISDMAGENVFSWKGVGEDTTKILIIGNEGQGISPDLYLLPHEIISIPIPGASESLNAAVAAGIMTYEILRKEGSLT